MMMPVLVCRRVRVRHMVSRNMRRRHRMGTDLLPMLKCSRMVMWCTRSRRWYWDCLLLSLHLWQEDVVSVVDHCAGNTTETNAC